MAKFFCGAAFVIFSEMLAYVVMHTRWGETVSPEVGMPWGLGFIVIVAAIIGSGIYGVFAPND